MSCDNHCYMYKVYAKENHEPPCSRASPRHYQGSPPFFDSPTLSRLSTVSNV